MAETRISFDAKKVVHNEMGYAVPNSYEGEKRYSFDYAQHIHIPHDPQELGPIYFLMPYKIGIFGIMCDTCLLYTSRCV